MPKSRGFTLIEILVVILIIGITISFAMLAFGDFGAKRRIVTTAQKFANYVTLVKQEAILESSTLGIRMNNAGYEVLKFQEPKTWQLMPQNVFHRQNFPSRMLINFKRKSLSNNPVIIVNASGDMTPFELQFGTEQEPNIATVIGKSDGSVTVTTP